MSRYYSKRKKQSLNTGYQQAIKAIGGLKTIRANNVLTIESISYKRGCWWVSSKESGYWTTTPINSPFFNITH